MHIQFLKYLVDPKTKEPVKLSPRVMEGEFVIEGDLYSSSGRYPIIRGVPRFVLEPDKNYVRSFSYQWRRWSTVQFESKNVGGAMQGHTLKMWERITAVEDSLRPGAVILDVGCGPGRFLEIVRMKGGKAIGIDLSDAVETAAEIFFMKDPDVLICQANALELPIKQESVDGAFSIGVLHHTPHPKDAFQEMVRAVKAGGWVAISVYGKGGYYDLPIVRLYRAFFKALWPFFRHYPPLIYSYLAAYLLRPMSYIPVLGLAVRTVFPMARLADTQWAFLDTFDSLTPSYQSAHTSYEVYSWFKSSNLIQIEPSDWSLTSYHAIKQGMQGIKDTYT